MFVSIYITASSASEAKELARNLIKKKLIACANIFPITSIFNWDGELKEESEFAMILKTHTELVNELIESVKENHSYDVPCIVAWPITNGNKDYLSWVEEETIES